MKLESKIKNYIKNKRYEYLALSIKINNIDNFYIQKVSEALNLPIFEVLIFKKFYETKYNL